jgi:hypothetical protein
MNIQFNGSWWQEAALKSVVFHQHEPLLILSERLKNFIENQTGKTAPVNVLTGEYFNLKRRC